MRKTFSEWWVESVKVLNSTEQEAKGWGVTKAHASYFGQRVRVVVERMCAILCVRSVPKRVLLKVVMLLRQGNRKMPGHHEGCGGVYGD